MISNYKTSCSKIELDFEVSSFNSFNDKCIFCDAQLLTTAQFNKLYCVNCNYDIKFYDFFTGINYIAYQNGYIQPFYKSNFKIYIGFSRSRDIGMGGHICICKGSKIDFQYALNRVNCLANLTRWNNFR